MNLLRISDAASIGLHALTLMAVEPESLYSTSSLARDLRVSRNHLAKVMQRLARAGLLRTARGPAGGYSLAMPPGRITLRMVMEAIDGRMIINGCLLKKRVCGGACLLGPVFKAINEQVVPFFSKTSVGCLAQSLKSRKVVKGSCEKKKRNNK